MPGLSYPFVYECSNCDRETTVTREDARGLYPDPDSFNAVEVVLQERGWARGARSVDLLPGLCWGNVSAGRLTLLHELTSRLSQASMHRLRILLTTALLFAATSAAVFAQGVEPGQSFTEKVAEVTDGDTFKLRRAVVLCRRFRPHVAVFSGASASLWDRPQK